jgi:(2Fe-2S) ferredoxin
MSRPELHLFICTNKRASGECCADKGAAALRDELKARLKKKHPEWKGKVRVNAAGCLGQCETGITAVLYPEGRWFERLTPDSLGKLEAELERAVAARDSDPTHEK